jgi:hypothetical protein
VHRLRGRELGLRRATARRHEPRLALRRRSRLDAVVHRPRRLLYDRADEVLALQRLRAQRRLRELEERARVVEVRRLPGRRRLAVDELALQAEQLLVPRVEFALQLLPPPISSAPRRSNPSL